MLQPLPLRQILTCYPGQTNHFSRAAPEKIPYAIERFRNETLRVYGVLEIQLSGKYTGEQRDYLAGNGKGKYSVADIKTWPWVKVSFPFRSPSILYCLLMCCTRAGRRPASARRT